MSEESPTYAIQRAAAITDLSLRLPEPTDFDKGYRAGLQFALDQLRPKRRTEE